ncbi:EAL domain, c-di-GMP-specific phosphodiesterase class I (or its enzymatically inactive variant) [Asanoa hainanensis]|uniref:EAL domain, c-di-GMP-specific phosphodiesterase class I (Or its enzymatically inactive variant) n=1 Tax=Asanoa hainanensis TaxID=560556 RepID=A0A239P8N4_9ACTN|nr:EAL domain-containing protein [Asanoa hainanensis]SNT63440.1 EAL domain, c-di-GMP-specific phosphodiesterase class I (or its enzymatically inactive variant) [Asanoa hainanensis]
MGDDLRFAADVGIEGILARRLVKPVFQPVVSLADERPVGFEALARGPEGPFHQAPALFAAAARAGLSAELDWLCASAAGQAYREADLPEMALFVNLNPDTLASDPPAELVEAYDELTQERDVVLEITEQSVMREPARLMEAVLDARRRKARIALDDIGVEPGSLAAMPLVNPDIIKLDRSIIQARTNSWAVSQVVNAVLDEAHRRDAQILAEGIERPEHLAVARSMGATLGQGYLFGRPGPLPDQVQRSERELARVTSRNVAHQTPFDLLAPTADIYPTSEEMFASMVGHIENQATQTTSPAILVVNVGDGDYDDESRIRHTYLTSRGIDVFVLGTGTARNLGNRIRGIALTDDDPLLTERTVLFVGSRYGSGAFARRDGDTLHAGTCYNPERVIEAVLTLVNRLPS